MPTCISKGCSNQTRGRKFNTKDNGKIYYDKKCRSCEHSLRRYGVTTPERKQGEVRGAPFGPLPYSEKEN